MVRPASSRVLLLPPMIVARPSQDGGRQCRRFQQQNRVVFDILEGRYRLVVAIHYSSGIVFIRFVGTHTAAYNGIDAETV
jgi:RelE-like HigB toxin of type II HigAB toxin-antitoxin system